MQTIINTELQSHLLRLYQIACADENFGVPEKKLLYQFAETRGVDTAYLDQILMNPVLTLEVPPAVEKRVEYLYDLALMIWADERVTDNEYNLLKRYCETFEFLPKNVTGICDYLIACATEGKSIHEVLQSIN